MDHKTETGSQEDQGGDDIVGSLVYRQGNRIQKKKPGHGGLHGDAMLFGLMHWTFFQAMRRAHGG
jgi:hypothetical protein